MSEEQIKQQIEEYNQTEELQRQRLESLFNQFDRMSGYRRVEFGLAGVWTNCWGWRPDLAKERFIDTMVHPITGYVIGQE